MGIGLPGAKWTLRRMSTTVGPVVLPVVRTKAVPAAAVCAHRVSSIVMVWISMVARWTGASIASIAEDADRAVVSMRAAMEAFVPVPWVSETAMPIPRMAAKSQPAVMSTTAGPVDLSVKRDKNARQGSVCACQRWGIVMATLSMVVRRPWHRIPSIAGLVTTAAE